MRVALISIAAQPLDRESGRPISIGGQSIARRQLGFALAAGCRKIIIYGDGATADAIALRHAAEEAGARFQIVSNGHGLLGAVRAADELLVIAPGLLTEDARALQLLEKPNTVLVLPSGVGVAAGFERIDLVRAWAGAMIVPGSLIERLADLPEDSDPHAALLRLALQAQVPEKRLPEGAVAEGGWTILTSDAGAVDLEALWLKRHLPAPQRNSASTAFARLALRPFARRLLAASRVRLITFACAFLALAGGLAAAWRVHPAAGFALVALGALLLAFAGAFSRLQAAPYVRERGWFDAEAIGPVLLDIALFGCGVLAIAGDTPARLFPPLVLIAALHATEPRTWNSFAGLIGDRALLAAVIAAAAAFGLGGIAIMSLALLVLALAIVSRRPAARG